MRWICILVCCIVVVDNVAVTDAIVCKASTSSNICYHSASVPYTSYYYTSCGFFGFDRCRRSRTRYTYRQEAICCEGWDGTPSTGSCTIPRCASGWDACPNHGTCVTKDCCACTDAHYSPHCEPCTAIINCDQHYCDTRYDQECRRCDYEHAAPYKAYVPKNSGGRSNRICEQQCSWRPDSKQCYPGRCTTGAATSCQCAPGYASPASDCMAIANDPVISHCLATVSVMHGDKRHDDVDADCTPGSNPETYANLRINHLLVNWTTSFSALSTVDYPLPYYINHPDRFKIGVVQAEVDWRIKRGAVTIDSGTIDCTQGHSADNPNIGILSCDYSVEILHNWFDNDRLEVVLKVLNGGYLQPGNYDSGPESTELNPKQYYTGRPLTSQAQVILFEFEPPVHCSLISNSCNDSMLDIGAPYTKEATINISVAGWEDHISGIKEYEYSVHQLGLHGNELQPVDAIHTDTASSTVNISWVYTLPESGLYCFLLSVADVAGNSQLARQFVMYDKHSTVEVSRSSDDNIVVTSAAQNTSYLWMTSLDEKVAVAWQNHFCNAFHRDNNLLYPIADHHFTINTGYEERQGQPPLSRSMQGIPNVNGIVSYEIAFDVDNKGGRSIRELDEALLRMVSNFQQEKAELNISLQDGNSLRIWIQATDVMNNTNVDKVLVHVDSTPALIGGVQLTRDGEAVSPALIGDVQLTRDGETVSAQISLDEVLVHVDSTPALIGGVQLTRDGEAVSAQISLDEAHLTKLTFVSYDYHSGLREVKWWMHGVESPDVVGGSGHLLVHKTTIGRCVAPLCYCISKDEECFYRNFTLIPDMNLFQHSDGEQSYIFTFEVTNNAILKATETFQITVTPPLTKSVTDVNLPSTISVTDVTQPSTISVTDVNPPSTKTVTDVNPPSTKTVTDVNPPSTKTVTDVNPPSTKSVTNVNPPSTKTVTDVNPPSTKSVTDVNPPSTKTVTDVNPPSTKSVMDVNSVPINRQNHVTEITGNGSGFGANIQNPKTTTIIIAVSCCTLLLLAVIIIAVSCCTLLLLAVIIIAGVFLVRAVRSKRNQGNSSIEKLSQQKKIIGRNNEHEMVETENTYEPMKYNDAPTIFENVHSLDNDM